MIPRTPARTSAAALLVLVVGLLPCTPGCLAQKDINAQQGDHAPVNPQPPSPYAQWENGPPTDANFFPLGVWAQHPRRAAKYKKAGINMFVGGWGFKEEWMAHMREHGIGIVCSFNEYAAENLDNPHFWAWLSSHEPDNAQSLDTYWKNDIARVKKEWPQLKETKIKWAVPVPPERVVEKHETLNEKDPSRPTFLILGRGVAYDKWIGRGHRTNHPEDYAEYAKGGDIVAYDIYPATAREKEVRGRLWYVARGIRRLQKHAGEDQVVWNAVGATNQTPGPHGKPDPYVVRAQVWISLIHGSQGIIYFVHQFKPRFIEPSVFADPEMAAGFTKVNKQVAALAPVLNSPTLDNHTRITSSVPASKELAAVDLDPIAVMTKQYGGATYVFAVRMEGTEATGTFTVKGAPDNATAEVIGENRELVVENGTFSDRFDGYAVHLYKIALP